MHIIEEKSEIENNSQSIDNIFEAEKFELFINLKVAKKSTDKVPIK
jgi:hypothetical protein